MSSLAQSPLRRAARSPERNRQDRQVDLARTLRGVRERLALRRPLSELLDQALLAEHAGAIRAGSLALFAPVLLAGLGVFLTAGPDIAALWSLPAVAATLLLLALARRVRRAGIERAERWTSLFLLGHLCVGGAFAALALLPCDACGPLRFEALLVAALLPAIAVYGVVAANLKGAILIGFMPMVVVLTAKALETGDAFAAGLLMLPVAAVPAMSLVSRQLRRTSTDRLRHRIERDELVAALEEERMASDEARRRAEEASHAKSRFLATMSHELRTPLNAILGFSEVVMKEILGPIGNDTYREYVGDIHSSGRHLLDLINEILDLSRIEAGRYALNEEALDLVAVTDDCRAFLQLKAQGKGLLLDMRYEENLPLLWGDRRAIRQIVLNLLSNAVKFAPGGTEIVLCVGWTAGGGQYVSVRDSGPGIPEHEIPLVLSSFGQGSSVIKSAEQGTGLGLPIVQALVHLHDGEFRLERGAGGGTQATAIFPHSRVLEVMPAMDEEF